MKNNIDSVISGATLNENGAIYVLTRKVDCEGSLEFSKHPKVYLKIKNLGSGEEKIVCPYCRQIFIYKNRNDA